MDSKRISVQSLPLSCLLKQALCLALGLKAEAEALVVRNVALEALGFSSLCATGRRMRGRVDGRLDASDEFLPPPHCFVILLELLLAEFGLLVEKS